MSSDPDKQKIYWHCIVGFFCSSRALNPKSPHIFYTNTTLPTIDGRPVARILAELDVSVINIPITYRITRTDTLSWGNQFYILDIIKHISSETRFDRYVVLDCDVVWIKPVDALADALEGVGVLTYELDADEHALDEAINGVTRGQMASLLARIGGPSMPSIPYLGGEIFAATRNEIARLAGQIDSVWPAIAKSEDVNVKEEAHFLSVLYALNQYPLNTANPFIKRMWTTFSHRNTSSSDFRLTLWHLPAEKKTGFRDMFALVPASPLRIEELGSAGFNEANYARLMGVPGRTPGKFIKDLLQKLSEKFLR